MRVPVFSELLTAASQQSLVIYVDGPLQYPNLRKEPFPGLKDAVQHLQSDLEGKSSGR